jgi:hypothetical protein
MSVPVSLIPEATAYAVLPHPKPTRIHTPDISISQLDRQKSPTVQHLQSYDRAMCEATLGTTPSSSSPSSSSNSKSSSGSSAPPPFHTNPTKLGGVKSKLGPGLGFGKTNSKSEKSGVDSKVAREVEGYPESKLVSNPPSDSGSKSHPTSPGALISQPSHNPLSQAHPDDIKKSLTTFEDPLGLGLETLPTTEHADKMVKKGERKIRLGSLLHSGKLVS